MSIETWRDGYQRGFLDGVQMREKLDEEQEHKLIKSRLERLAEMREEWDEDYYDYYHAGMTIGTSADVTYRFPRPFDDVVFPDKCQECDGNCRVC